MTRRESIDAENAKAMRLAAALMWSDTPKDGGCSVNVMVGLRRDEQGHAMFTVRIGEFKSSAPSLGEALLGVLDQAGLN